MKTIDRLLLLVIAGVLAGTYYFTNSHVPSPVEQKSVSVVGVGEASATPDQLTITFSIAQTGATTQAAQKLVNQNIDTLRKGLSELGVSEMLKTEAFRTSPDYDWEDWDRVSLGYQTEASYSIKLAGADFEKRGNQILQLLPEIWNIEVDSTVYGLSSLDKPKLEAREKAFENAKMQAEQIAKLSGKKLGKVLVISADSMDRDYERPYYPMAMMAKSSVAELADETTEVVSAGEEKISAQLEVVFTLE